MKKLLINSLFILTLLFLISCENHIFKIRVSFCNNKRKDTIINIRTCKNRQPSTYTEVETYEQALPILKCVTSDGNRLKLINVCEVTTIEQIK